MLWRVGIVRLVVECTDLSNNTSRQEGWSILKRASSKTHTFIHYCTQRNAWWTQNNEEVKIKWWSR
jgi:hypothetical protein